MKASARRWARAALAVAVVACGGAVGQDTAGLPLDGVYTGPVKARILVPGSGADAPEVGRGSATFAGTPGRSTLSVKASIREAGDAGFEMTGAANGPGWRGGTGALGLEIDRAGRISGGGVENNHRISFAGRATATDMALTVETVKLAPTADGTLPPGTRIVFDYNLSRAGGAAQARLREQPNGAATTKPKCKRQVWRVRNVTTPGGGMTMVRVPHCVN